MVVRLTARRVAVMMALSGGATLAGEALGARLLRPMLGSTALAQTGTLAGILGALGLGAWYAGRTLAHERVTPSRLFALAHAGLAIWSLLGAFVPQVVTVPVARVLVSLSERTPWAGDLARLVLAVTLTAVPGALAGAAYPSAVALLSRGAGAGTALVGAASSLGAAAAAMATTFVLCPSLGLSWTLALTACVYAALAGVAAWSSQTSPQTPSKKPSEAKSVSPVGVVPAVLLLGVASTAWQVLLGRAGALAFGPSAFTFAAALAAHVTALGVGELLAYRRVKGCDLATARGALGSLVLVATVAAVLSLRLLMGLPAFSAWLLARGAPPQHTLWLAAYGAMVVAALPVVACLGAAMTFAARLFAGDSESSGAQANGRVLGAMAMGNVLGALVTTFVALPHLALERTSLAVALTLAGATALVRSRASAVVMAAVIALVAARGREGEPGDLLRGPFLYTGSRHVELGRLVWWRDDPEATVAVRRDDEGNVLLQIDGKVDATSLGDANTQTVVGIIPVAMARETHDVLVVGLGSGMTVDAVRSVPGVQSVTVAELVDSVVRAAREDFGRANHHALDDARVHVIRADAAHYLRGTTRTYDAIVSEPSNPWVAGMSDLFTREAFTAARERLRPGGAFGAWFHAYGTSADVVASIVATFREVFPTATLMEVSTGQDYLLVGLREPARLDLDLFLRRIDDPTVTRTLRAAGIADHASLLTRFLAGTRGVAAIARGAPVLRASDLVLEFRAPALLYNDATADVFALLGRVDDLPLAGMVADARPGSTWLRLLDESESRREAITHTRAMVLAQAQGDYARAIREGELAVGYDTHDLTPRTILARLYLARAATRRAARDPGGAEEDLTMVLELRPPAAERFRALVKLGDLAARRHDGQRALSRYTESLTLAGELGQTAPELRVRRAEALAMLGAPEQAAEEFDRAIRETRDEGRRRELEAIRGGLTRRR